MVERRDMVALHEPFCNLADYGETDVDGLTLGSPAALITWLHDQTNDVGIGPFTNDETEDHFGQAVLVLVVGDPPVGFVSR